ncbi:hypothetical protein EDD18DRAFT_1182497 [Armillaria luteobubalina]|uniref:Uncharacterized protein n=1 Tax=Armillaria luteobubalina TaxID=153913 RepID=A0AA39PZZ2_9AGAR|nr:hypothetical protein EDD18DRAFT_1182497 [Armillaria luteobubalina]
MRYTHVPRCYTNIRRRLPFLSHSVIATEVRTTYSYIIHPWLTVLHSLILWCIYFNDGQVMDISSIYLFSSAYPFFVTFRTHLVAYIPFSWPFGCIQRAYTHCVVFSNPRYTTTSLWAPYKCLAALLIAQCCMNHRRRCRCCHLPRITLFPGSWSR